MSNCMYLRIYIRSVNWSQLAVDYFLTPLFPSQYLDSSRHSHAVKKLATRLCQCGFSPNMHLGHAHFQSSLARSISLLGNKCALAARRASSRRKSDSETSVWLLQNLSLLILGCGIGEQFWFYKNQSSL